LDAVSEDRAITNHTHDLHRVFWKVIIADKKFADATKATMSAAWDCAIAGDETILRVFKS